MIIFVCVKLIDYIETKTKKKKKKKKQITCGAAHFVRTIHTTIYDIQHPNNIVGAAR